MENPLDRISFLPDELLLEILPLLPKKDVFNTTVLSKRWRYLWKLVPKLKYIDCDKNADQETIVRFIDRSLLLSMAPVLESLHLSFRKPISDLDIGFWVRIAVERGLQYFDYCHSLYDAPSRLPQSLFTCGTLVELKLTKVSLVDVIFPVNFQFLKTLHLRSVIYFDDATARKLLSSCPILEVLVVYRIRDDNVISRFSINVPSLQKLFYDGRRSKYDQFVLNAPSLKCLKVLDRGILCKIEKMPEIVTAHVQAIYWDTEILSSLTSLKRLSLCLCLPSKSPFPTGKFFHQLEDLEFCTFDSDWDLLMSLLKHSPKLRSLKLSDRHGNIREERMYHWDEPSSVPETLIYRLETLEWRNYKGWKIQKELATFILKHSRRLRTAIFSPIATTLENKHRMLTDLTLLSRGSSSCQLVFG